ncbi:MAG: Ig-like domain-containing protein [Byssovorax sp.]
MSRPRSPALLALTACVLGSACLPGLVVPPHAPVHSSLEITARRTAPGIAAGPLRVVFASPEGEAESDAAVTLVFNKPMRALGIAPSAADAPASIAPAIAGKWRWIGGLALRFEPDAPLPGATTFRVEIPAGTRSLDGSQLDAASVLAFTTPRPALGATDPKDGAERVDEKKPIRLWFNQPIADAEIARAVTITIGTSPRRLPFTLAHHEGLAVDLALKTSLPRDAEVHVRVDPSLRAEVGDRLADRAAAITFHTVGPLRIASFGCALHPLDASLCDPAEGTITLHFSNPVDGEDVHRALTVTPRIPFLVDATYERSADVVVRASFAAGGTYRLHVGPVVDALGQALTGTATRALRFGDLAPSTEVGLAGTYWAPLGKHPFPIAAVNVTDFAVSAAPLGRDDVLRRLADATFEGPKAAWHSLEGPPHNERSWRDAAIEDLLGKKDLRGPFLLRSSGSPTPGGAPTTDAREVQITDLALSTRAAHDGVLVWLTRLSTGAPIAGAAVELLHRDAPGSPPIASAITGADGLASLPRESLAKAEQVVVVARSGDDWAYRAIPLPTTPEPVGLLFTERGIYRPGERVSLEGMFRVPDTRGLRTPRGRVVEVWVLDANDKEIARSKQTLSTFGTFTTEIPIRRDAPLGDYLVHAAVDGVVIGRRGFTVHEYRPAESTAHVTADRAEYVRGDAITCTARGRYLYGGPMTGALASIVVSRSTTYVTVPGLEDWIVGDSLDYRTFPDLGTSHGQLDGAGEWSSRTPLTNPGQVGPEQIGCAIEIADKNRQITSDSTSAIVHPGEVYIAIRRPRDTAVEPGAEILPELLTVTPRGERRSLPVHVELIRRITSSAAPPKDAHVASCDVTTADDPVSCKLASPRAKVVENDSLILRATSKDARGNPLTTAISFDRIAPRKPVVEEPTAPSPPPAPTLSLQLGQRHYRVGETAHLTWISRYTGPVSALITAEREGILWQRAITFNGAAPSIDVPITAEMIPSIDLMVRVVAGGATEEASFEADVDPEPRHLHVAVHAPVTRVEPGAEIEVDVEVNDARGKPARAEVTLYGADEGSLQLTYYRTPDPLHAMYDSRGSAVLGADARDDLVRSTRGDLHHGVPHVRMGATQSSHPRGDFRQTVIFAPHLITDAAGHVRRRVRLPDGLTSYRFMAVAATEGDDFGAAEANVRTSKPLMLRPTIPRVIRAGDRFEASLVVSTIALPATTVEITAKADGFTVEAPSTRSVHLDAGTTAEVRFPLRADHAGPARIAFHAIASGLTATDDVELKATVVPPIALETTAIYGETTSAVAERLGDLTATRDDAGALTLTLASTPLASLAQGVEQLLDYPHGCTEQTVSRMLPLLALRDLSTEIGVKLPDDIPATLNAAAARLVANQRPDGGFGLWPESTTSEPWITAWALWGLSEAQRRGVAVPVPAIGRAVLYLRGLTDAKALSTPENEGERALAAFVVDVLAATGEVDRTRVELLIDAPDRLPTFARALLLHALAIAWPGDARVATLARDLESRVQLDGPVARARSSDRESRPGLLDSPVRTSALVLRALLAVDPAHPLASRLAAGLLADRRGGAWRTTHETAWALLALDAFRAAHPTPAARFDGRVFLDQALLAEATFGAPPAPPSVTLTLPTARLRAAGSAPLTFAVVGSGQLSYEARLTYARAELPKDPIDAGFFAQRSLRVLAGAGEVPGVSAPTRIERALTAGDLVLGEIEIVTAAPRDFVVIDDPLPGGVEAVDLDLGLGGAWLRRIDPGRYTRREFSDARVLYFLDHVPAGVTRLRYLARATGIGRFVRPPLHVEEMYAPEVFGQTAAEVITIVPAP